MEKNNSVSLKDYFERILIEKEKLRLETDKSRQLALDFHTQGISRQLDKLSSEQARLLAESATTMGRDRGISLVWTALLGIITILLGIALFFK